MELKKCFNSSGEIVQNKIQILSAERRSKLLSGFGLEDKDNTLLPRAPKAVFQTLKNGIREFTKLKLLLQELEVYEGRRRIFIYCTFFPTMAIVLTLIGLLSFAIISFNANGTTATTIQVASLATTEKIEIVTLPMDELPESDASSSRSAIRSLSEDSLPKLNALDSSTLVSDSDATNPSPTSTNQLPVTNKEYPYSPSPRFLIPSTPKATQPPHSTSKDCPPGSCSFDEFRIPIPRNVNNCTSVIPIPINPGSRKRSKMEYIKCDTNCSYYSVTMEELVFPLLFEEKISEIGTMTINMASSTNCEDADISSRSYNASFSGLKWLRLKIPYECPEIYKTVSTFQHSINLLSLDRLYVSPMNYPYIKEIVRQSSKIKTLIITNITLCIRCDIFGDTFFEDLETVTLLFTKHSNMTYVFNQLEKLISNSPKLKKLITNVVIPVSKFDQFSKYLRNLERAKIYVGLDFNNGQPYFSLNLLKDLTNMKYLTIYVDVNRSMYSNINSFTVIKINDFEQPSSPLQRIFIRSISHRLNVEGKAERFCTTEFGQTKNTFTCKRG